MVESNLSITCSYNSDYQHRFDTIIKSQRTKLAKDTAYNIAFTGERGELILTI